MGGFGMTADNPVSTGTQEELICELTIGEEKILSELAGYSRKSIPEYVRACVQFAMSDNEEETSNSIGPNQIVLDLSEDDQKKLKKNILGILLRKALKEGRVLHN